MKKTLAAFVITLSFVACKSSTDTKLDSNKDLILLADTSKPNNAYLADTGMAATAATRNAETVTPVEEKKTTVVKEKNVTHTSAPVRTNSGTATSTAPSTTGSSTTTTTTTTAPAAEPEKEGISKSAKGAIIGGVGGAVVGGIIGHNIKGAAIGAAAGAGGGYIIGRKKDKKDGRVN